MVVFPFKKPGTVFLRILESDQPPHPNDLQELHGASSKSLDGNSSSSMIRTSHLDDIANSPTEGTLEVATHGICRAKLTEKKKHYAFHPQRNFSPFKVKRSERPRHSALVQSRIHNTIKRIFQNDIEFQCSIKVVVADNFNPCSLQRLTSQSTRKTLCRAFETKNLKSSNRFSRAKFNDIFPLADFSEKNSTLQSEIFSASKHRQLMSHRFQRSGVCHFFTVKKRKNPLGDWRRHHHCIRRKTQKHNSFDHSICFSQRSHGYTSGPFLLTSPAAKHKTL